MYCLGIPLRYRKLSQTRPVLGCETTKGEGGSYAEQSRLQVTEGRNRNAQVVKGQVLGM